LRLSKPLLDRDLCDRLRSSAIDFQISLWVLLAAPLLSGNDLTKMTPETIAILTDRDVIAIDHDPEGRKGDRVWAEGQLEVWAT
jgi:alpha-galactosidase